MHNWTIVGHDHIKSVLDSQFQSGQLSHAYLFLGPAGVGKSVLAKEFAKKISQSVGDQFYLDLAESGSVENIRELLKLVSLTSVTGGYKTVILNNFQTATNAASNALLKTLEEPPELTIFFLLSSSLNILPTVVSRCVSLRFGKLSNQDMVLFAAIHGLQADETTLRFAAGLPQQLENYLSGDEQTAEIASLLKQLEEVCKQSASKKMVMLQNLSDYETPVLIDTLNNWIHLLRQKLETDPEAYKAMMIAQETLKRFSMNANKKLTLEYFLINTQI